MPRLPDAKVIIDEGAAAIGTGICAALTAILYAGLRKPVYPSAPSCEAFVDAGRGLRAAMDGLSKDLEGQRRERDD